MIGSGFCGFSANLITRLVSSVVMMPNSLARSSGTSTTPTVMSASHCLVVRDHRTVVHFVDVIARQDQHVRRMVRPNEFQILIHRIGGAAIPVGADLLLRRNQLDELAELAAQIAPAALDVLDQRLGLVLRQHRDLTDAGIDAIRQHEIDDAELAAERRRRFAAMLRESLEALAAPSRHDHRQGAARQSADVASGVVAGSVSHYAFKRDILVRPPCTSFLAGVAEALC